MASSLGSAWLTCASSSLLLALLGPACSEVRFQTDEESRPADTDGPDDPDDPDDPDVPEPLPATFCPSASFSGGARDAVALLLGGVDVSLLLRDGTTTKLDLPIDPPAPVDRYPWAAAVAGGDVIMVTVGWATFGPGSTSSYRTRWFSRSGDLLDELIGTQQQSPIGVGPDGTSVLFQYDAATLEGSYRVRLPDGSVRQVGDFVVSGSPLPDGWLRGTNEASGAFGFYDPRSGEQHGLTDSAPLSHPLQDAGGFHYISSLAAVPSLISESPTELRTTPLWDMGEATPYLVDLKRGRFALISLADERPGEARFRVDLEAGSVVSADAAPPAGSSTLTDNCGFSTRTLADDGRVLGALRRGGDGLVGALDPATGEWSSVGEPLANPGSFAFREVGGTYLIVANDGSGSFCPALEWTEPPSEGAIGFDQFQIVRPATGSSHLISMLDGYWLDIWSVNLTSDGACAFLPTPDAGGRILDVAGGAELAIDSHDIIWLE